MKTLIKNLFALMLCIPLTLSAQWTDSGTHITTNDNVGIGVTNPEGKLTVYSPSGQRGLESLNPNGNSHFPWTNGWSYLSGEGLIFRTNSNTERMRIQPNGNVGIGTVSPAHKLHVAGNLYTTGSIKSASRTYYFGNGQYLYGDDAHKLNYYSNHSATTMFSLKDKENKHYGSILGNGNGANFGLLDGDGNWSYLAVKDDYTALKINSVDIMRLKADGNVGIGITNPTHKLSVNGNIRAKEVRVETGWSDYVFYDDYQLPTLEEEEQYIEEKGHLLGFESEKDMQGEVLLGDVSKRQQAKIEEMMLHLIQINKQLKTVETKVTDLEQKNTQLKKQLSNKK